MSKEVEVLDKRKVNLERLSMGETLGEMIPQVIRLGGSSLLKCESPVSLHSLRLLCLPKIKEEAHVKVYAEFDYPGSLLGDEPLEWLLFMEDYATNEAALVRYDQLREKIKDGKYYILISIGGYEHSKIEFF